MRHCLCGMIGVIVGLLAASIGRTEDTVKLRYRFVPGTSVYYSGENELQCKVDIISDTQTMKYGRQRLKHFIVKSVNDEGTATLEWMIDRVKMTMLQRDEIFNFDTAVGGAVPNPFAGVEKTVGQLFGEMVVTAQGRILSAPVPVKSETSPPNAMVPAAETDDQFFAILPEAAAVAIDAEWDHDFNATVLSADSQQKSVDLRSHYRLKAVEAGQAQISLRTEVLTPLDKYEESQLINATSRGTIVFDVDAGQLVSRELKLKNTVAGFQGPKSALTVESVSHERIVRLDQATFTFASSLGRFPRKRYHRCSG